MKRLLVACLLMAAACKEEATFQGMPTRYWLEQLKSDSATARARAANALTHLGPEAKRAIPDLIKLLDDREPLVRWSAATTLGEFGPASRGAAPALERLAAKDPEAVVRDAAGWALKQLTSEAE